MLGRRRPQVEATPVTVAPPIVPRDVEVRVALPMAPSEVPRWFCDPGLWVKFQGQQASLDPRPGGRLRIDMGDRIIIAGNYLEVGDDHVAFSWGCETDTAMPPGSTVVRITAEPAGEGRCTVILRHEGLVDDEHAAEHRSGWRYHLTRLGVAATGSSGPAAAIDLFLAAASEIDPVARRGLLDRVCSATVVVADDTEEVQGVAALARHFERVAGDTTPRLVRTGPVERVGMLVRCPYSVRKDVPGDSATAGELEHGQLIAALDRKGLISALSLFA